MYRESVYAACSSCSVHANDSVHQTNMEVTRPHPNVCEHAGEIRATSMSAWHTTAGRKASRHVHTGQVTRTVYIPCTSILLVDLSFLAGNHFEHETRRKRQWTWSSQTVHTTQLTACHHVGVDSSVFSPTTNRILTTMGMRVCALPWACVCARAHVGATGSMVRI